MIYDVFAYILIGSLFIGIMVPLIALLRESAREQKRLDEVKTAKKREPPQLTEENWYSFID